MERDRELLSSSQELEARTCGVSCLYFLCTAPELLEYSTQISPESQTLFIIMFGIGLNGCSVLSCCSKAQNEFSFHPDYLNNLYVCEGCYRLGTMGSEMLLNSLGEIFRETIATTVAYILGFKFQVCLSLNTNPRNEVSLSSVGVTFLYSLL